MTVRLRGGVLLDIRKSVLAAQAGGNLGDGGEGR